MAIVSINDMESLLSQLAASEVLCAQEESRTRTTIENRLSEMFGRVLDSLEENRQLRERLKSLTQQENQAACEHATKVKGLLQGLQGLEARLDAMPKELDALEKKLSERVVSKGKMDYPLKQLDEKLEAIKRTSQSAQQASTEYTQGLRAYQADIDQLMAGFLSGETQEVFPTYRSYSVGYNTLYPWGGGGSGSTGSGTHPIKMASVSYELQQANQMLTGLMTRMANREANLVPLKLIMDRLDARICLFNAGRK